MQHHRLWHPELLLFLWKSFSTMDASTVFAFVSRVHDTFRSLTAFWFKHFCNFIGVFVHFLTFVIFICWWSASYHHLYSLVCLRLIFSDQASSWDSWNMTSLLHASFEFRFLFLYSLITSLYYHCPYHLSFRNCFYTFDNSPLQSNTGFSVLSLRLAILRPSTSTWQPEAYISNYDYRICAILCNKISWFLGFKLMFAGRFIS